MKYFPINCAKYQNKGCNKYLILLHGWGSSSVIFNKYINELKNDFNIIAFDLYGFGQSVDPKPFFDTYEYAVQIYLYLQSRGVSEVYIFAHSFGGRIAIILSSLFGLNVKKMVLTGCAGIKPRRSLMYYLKVKLYKFRKKFGINNYDEFGSDDYKNSNSVMKRVLVRVVNQELEYLLDDVNCNTLLVWGSEDNDTPLYMYKKILHGIDSVRGVIIRGAHFAAFTHMYLCNNKIREFLLYD